MSPLDEARRHLEALARAPRPAGGERETAARRYCADELSRLGFTVHDRPVEYSALPGRWGTPMAGALLIALMLTASYLGAHRRPGLAAAALLITGAVLLLGAVWLTRVGVLRLGAMRQEGANLECVRGDPKLWLVAHLDSKSQPVPILARALGIVLTALAWLGAVALAVVGILGGGIAGSRVAWMTVAVIGVLAALPVVASTVGTRSPGAIDDASGVATVLVAAGLLPVDAPIGVLLTTAEELGLAGARHWVKERQTAVAINVDGVDDLGPLTVMHGWTGAPTLLLDHLLDAAATNGVQARARRLIPGVLVDAVALGDAGWKAVTVSKGTIETVVRIHRPGDSVDRLTGVGCAEVAAVLARAIWALLPAVERNPTLAVRGIFS